jgi:hypothetical protein
MPRKKTTPNDPELQGPDVPGSVPKDVLETTPETTKKVALYTPSQEGPVKPKPRLSFGLTENGVIDVSTTRAETMARIKDFFNNPENAALLGKMKADDLISDQDVEMLLDVVGTVEGYAFHFAAKIDLDIAQRNAYFNKDQKALLVGPTKAVLTKYSNSLAAYLRWKDEIALAGILLMLTRAKLENAKKEQAERKEEKIKLDNSQNPAFERHELPNMGPGALSSEIGETVKN